MSIRAIGFDWDGTLVDSLSAKGAAFAQSVTSFYPQVAGREGEIAQHYLQTRGNLRFQQLALLQNAWGLEPLSVLQTQAWSDQFTTLYSQMPPALFPETLLVLQTLRGRGHHLFLSSSVPQNHLDATLSKYPEIVSLLKMRLGTSEDRLFRKGKPHLEFVSGQLGLPLSEFAFVGDAVEDVLGAQAAGVLAVGVVHNIPGARAELESIKPDLLVESLTELSEHFPEVRSEPRLGEGKA